LRLLLLLHWLRHDEWRNGLLHLLPVQHVPTAAARKPAVPEQCARADHFRLHHLDLLDGSTRLRPAMY
jgi:hypothetical protein